MLRYVDMPEDRWGNDPWVFSADDQCWDDETLLQLKTEYNVIFMTAGRGVIPVMISDQWGLVLGVEDDGTLYFKRQYGQPEMCFSEEWAQFLIADMKEALRLIQSKKEK